MRRAKIVCTLGPATSTPEQIRALVDAGMDVARLNLSHGSYADHEAVYRAVRQATDESGRGVGVLVDLQGPKIRLGTFADGPVSCSRPATCSRSPPRTSPGDATVCGDDVQGPARRRPGRRPRSSSTTARFALRVVDGRRPERRHRGHRGRPGVQQQGHQPARRRGQRPRAVREGQRRPALGAAAGRRPRSRCRSSAAPTTSTRSTRSWTRRASGCRSSPRSRSRRPSSNLRRDRRRVRRHHGRPRRPRRRAAARAGAARAEARGRAARRDAPSRSSSRPRCSSR